MTTWELVKRKHIRTWEMISGSESLSFLLIDPKEGSYSSSPCSFWCNQTQIYLVFLILSLTISKKVVYSLQHFPNRLWEFNAWNMCSIIQSFPIFSTVFDSSLINKAFSANSKIVPAKISFFFKGLQNEIFSGDFMPVLPTGFGVFYRYKYMTTNK